MISSHGVEYFEKYIRIVIEKAQDKETHLREAYRGVLVFLPGCFDRYVEYLLLKMYLNLHNNLVRIGNQFLFVITNACTSND